MLIGREHPPGASTELEADVCWMHERALTPGKKYLLKHTSHTVQAVVTKIVNRLDMATLETEATPAELKMNDIGQIRLHTAKPLVFDGYATNRLTGSFILIEQGSNATAAAGMLLAPREVVKPESGDNMIWLPDTSGPSPIPAWAAW